MDIKGGIKGGLQIPDILENSKEQEIKNQNEEIKKYFKTQVENCPKPPESPFEYQIFNLNLRYKSKGDES
jgi:hypothetical protein